MTVTNVRAIQQLFYNDTLQTEPKVAYESNRICSIDNCGYRYNIHDSAHRYFNHDQKSHALICNCGYGSLILTEFNEHLQRHHTIHLQPTINPEHLNYIVVNFLFSGVRPFVKLSSCNLCPFQTPIPKFHHSHSDFNGPPFTIPAVNGFLKNCANEYVPYKEPDYVRHNAAQIKREQEIAARELREREARAEARQLEIERQAAEQRRQDEERRRLAQQLFDQRERKKVEIEDATSNTVQIALQMSREKAKADAAKQRAEEAQASLQRRDPTPDFSSYTPTATSPSQLGAAAPAPRFAKMSPQLVRPSLPPPPPVHRATPPSATGSISAFTPPRPILGKSTPIPSLLDIAVAPPPALKHKYPATDAVIPKGNPAQEKCCKDRFHEVTDPTRTLSPNPFRPLPATADTTCSPPEPAQFDDAQSEPGPPTSALQIPHSEPPPAPAPSDDWDDSPASQAVPLESTNPAPSAPKSARDEAYDADYPALTSSLHPDSDQTTAAQSQDEFTVVTKTKRNKRRERVKAGDKELSFKAKTELGSARVLAKGKPQPAGGDAPSQPQPRKSSVMWDHPDAITRNVTQRSSYVPHRPYLRHMEMETYRKTDKPLEPMAHRNIITQTPHKFRGHIFPSQTIPECTKAPNYLILFPEKISVGQYYIINSKNDCCSFAHITFHPSNQSYHTPQIHKHDKDFNPFKYPIFAPIEENTEAERKLYILTMSNPLKPGRYLFHDGPVVSDSQDRGMAFFALIEELQIMFGVYRRNPEPFRPWYTRRHERIEAEKARQLKKKKPNDPDQSNRFAALQ